MLMCGEMVRSRIEGVYSSILAFDRITKKKNTVVLRECTGFFGPFFNWFRCRYKLHVLTAAPCLNVHKHDFFASMCTIIRKSRSFPGSVPQRFRLKYVR